MSMQKMTSTTDERSIPDEGETILVTGGAGFIGANVIRLLLAHGYQVRVLDDLSTGHANYLSGLDVVTVTGDIRDPSTVATALDGCSKVVHLAASSSVLESVKDPMPTFRVNVEGTLTLLQAAIHAGADKFILASSNAALGEHSPPLHEEIVPSPISPYGASKLAAEGYCAAFHGSHGLDTVVLRFANVYGPFSAHKTSVIAKFLRLLAANEPITIYGDGSQTRDFVYVDDIAQAILSAITKPVGGVTMQIGTGRETSIRDLVSLLRDVTGSSSPVNYSAPQPGEIQRNYAAIERARDILGFEPRWNLRDGIRATIDWFAGTEVATQRTRQSSC